MIYSIVFILNKSALAHVDFKKLFKLMNLCHLKPFGKFKVLEQYLRANPAIHSMTEGSNHIC